MLLLSPFAFGFAKNAYSLYRWKASIWAMNYWTTPNPDPEIPDNEKHILFFMVDHYEPGTREGNIENNRAWLDKFRVISDKYRDDFGTPFQYTWFYPNEARVKEIAADLADAVRDGYGEVELHWHISAGDLDKKYGGGSFAEHLAEAIQWYQQFGFFITDEPEPKTAFAYIAGNWDLDGVRTPQSESHGITDQITQLNKAGCYADFTYSTIGTNAQPAKVNAIYYVTDDPTVSKSHNTGVDVEVGKVVDDRFMIFQGPIEITWNGELEYGAMESDPSFSPARIDKWIDANIHVHGRPEWVFVKVYSHGMQSRFVVLDHDMAWMLESLKQRCEERGIKLHFVTAREAYNIVKAAEAGEKGNPEEYRDYKIPPYQASRKKEAKNKNDSLVGLGR